MSEYESGKSSVRLKIAANINPAYLLFCLVPSLLLGIVRLPETFTGDQAMFVVYAERLLNGAMLYADIWDVKQPGIFYFYLTGGALFGFTEYGIHLFELLYWLLFSVVSVYLLRDHFSNIWLVYFVPTFTVGYYYLTVGSLQMTQVESLANFPVALSFLLIPKLAISSRPLRWYAICLVSGLSIAAAIALKFAFLPLVTALSTIAIVLVCMQHPDFSRRKAIAALVGIWSVTGVSLFLITFWVYRLGIFDQLYYTTFVYPREAVSLHGGGERLSVLSNSLVWFTLTFFPLLMLILAGSVYRFFTSARTELAIRSFRDNVRSKQIVIAACMAVWLFVGLLVILIQSTSWWSYHFMLLLMPFGLLALGAIDRFLGSCEMLNRRSVLCQFTIVAIFFFTIASLFNIFTVREIKRLYRDRDLGYANGPAGPHGDNWDMYQQVLDESRTVGFHNVRNRSMFVCSDPLYYYLNRQTPAISTNGWMPEFFVGQQWRILEEEISASKPGILIVDSDCEWLISKNSVRLRQEIDSEYEVIMTTAKTTWWKRIDDGASNEPSREMTDVLP